MTAPGKPRRNGAQPPDAATEVERLAAVPEPTRGGEDVRRRGWFWHWNALVTQYAPLIGLKGVGLLNSYTVWTDRREESPHRGYAFPSQQSEADFYGEDRAELITINKILVALDLIEIRKEMVVRADPQGRRWKVPHNFYRVKDHGDDFTLTTGDVLRVAELAAKDRAVYRYVRRVFSPRFAPIDGDNVWTRILPDVRITALWQELSARAAAEEDRASARTRAGHAARKGVTPASDGMTSHDAPRFFAPHDGDGPAREPDGNDSATVSTHEGEKTSVAPSNTGLTAAVDESNRGSRRKRPGSVGPGNNGGPTAVAPANTTYHQSHTTTSESGDGRRKTERARGVASPETGAHHLSNAGGPGAAPPADAAGEAAALRAFESANDRAATPAERKLLRDLAQRLDPVAAAAAAERDDENLPASGWGWIEAAVWEAVEAGSAFVAPRRLREILLRWEREGFPGGDGGWGMGDGKRRTEDRVALREAASTARRRDASARVPSPIPHPPSPAFTIAEVGLSSRQVWAAALEEMRRRGSVGRGELETWLRPAVLIGREEETLILGAPNAVARERIATRLLPAVRDALAATIGVAVAVDVVVAGEADEGERAAG